MNIHPEFRVFGDMRPVGYSDEVILSDIWGMADEIESFYGPMVQNWVLRFVVFAEESLPCIYYPDGFSQTVGIRLVPPALSDADYARFQMAHELVHCLAPAGKGSDGRVIPANVIGEAVAVKFQCSYLHKRMKHAKSKISVRGTGYDDALMLYNEFTKFGKGLVQRIRLIEPYFHKWTHDAFVAAAINVPEDLERKLLMKFDDFRKECRLINGTPLIDRRCGPT